MRSALKNWWCWLKYIARFPAFWRSGSLLIISTRRTGRAFKRIDIAFCLNLAFHISVDVLLEVQKFGFSGVFQRRSCTDLQYAFSVSEADKGRGYFSNENTFYFGCDYL